MLCYMHQGTPYGHLTLPAVSEDGGKDILRLILPPVLARMVGGTSEDVERLLAELEHAGVFSRTPEGVIFSRRMIQDEKLRETRANGGASSLNNPNVPRRKDNRKDTLEGSLEGSLPVSFGGSPSSSSSSSKNITSEPEIGSDQANASTQKKPTSTPSRQAAKLTALLKSEILRNKADYRITTAQERNWAVTAQRMLDIDKRDPEQIAKLIRWVQRDEFEMSNVLSMDKLRARFDQLELKARKTNPGSTPATYVSASERLLQERNAERTAAGGVQ